jgi:hypothetical protein
VSSWWDVFPYTSNVPVSRPAQWATLDELLDKLLFLTVSGDGTFYHGIVAQLLKSWPADPAYITHFLLTYRRFASPRSVLLAMQKRMRQLDNPSGDPMFACFAQMRSGALTLFVVDVLTFLSGFAIYLNYGFEIIRTTLRFGGLQAPLPL